MRAEPSHKSEMVSQLLFGERYEVVATKTNWVKVKATLDGYEGWIDQNQHFELNEAETESLDSANPYYISDLIGMVDIGLGDSPVMLLQGSVVYQRQAGSFWWFENEFTLSCATSMGTIPKTDIPQIAMGYLNSPYLWGGKSPIGIDCSGFSQMVYRLCGHKLPRDAKDQALLGEPLSFIEEAEPGDLAFFDNSEGDITHVGILLRDNYIIHASAHVRIDRLDQHGIYNPELRKHTHNLRVIKKII